MIYIPDSVIEQLLLDDIQYGDLTTQSLNMNDLHGEMLFTSRQSCCVSGLTIAEKMLQKLNLKTEKKTNDGHYVNAGSPLLLASGNVSMLHQGWKAAQNVLEWCSGVSHYVYQMKQITQRYSTHAKIACTRKVIPGTKLLAIHAILSGGGIMHRIGCAESILLFANHRRFQSQPYDWKTQISGLKKHAPEKKIIIEVETMTEAQEALLSQPDIVQMDKFPPEQVKEIIEINKHLASPCQLSVAGGINLNTIENYAKTGIELFITSAPYYAQPADISVYLSPIPQ